MPAALCRLLQYVSAWPAVLVSLGSATLRNFPPRLCSCLLRSCSVPTRPPLHCAALLAHRIFISALWISVTTICPDSQTSPMEPSGLLLTDGSSHRNVIKMRKHHSDSPPHGEPVGFAGIADQSHLSGYVKQTRFRPKINPN